MLQVFQIYIKAWCKSQEKCINCGGLKQDHTREICTRPQHCVNCNGEHKSTYKGCQIYERNKSIYKIMAYRNYSYREAAEVMDGRESTINRNNNSYDRYREPERWPALMDKQYSHVVKNKGENRKEARNTKEDRYKISKDRDRKEEDEITERRIRINEQNKQRNEKYKRKEIKSKNYYNQFNNRENEISKENYGIELRRPEERRPWTSGRQQEDDLLELKQNNNERRENKLKQCISIIERDKELNKQLYEWIKETNISIKMAEEERERIREEEERRNKKETARKKQRNREKEIERQVIQEWENQL